MNRAVDLLSDAVLAVITRSRDHHHTRIYEAAHGLANRVVFVGVDGGRAKTHVNHADVVCGAVGHQPVERAQESRSAAPPRGVEHTQVDDARVGSDADIVALRNRSVTGGNGGDMSAVSVWIISAVLACKVNTRHDAGAVARVLESYVV